MPKNSAPTIIKRHPTDIKSKIKPMHLSILNNDLKNIRIVDPLGYFEFIKLVKNSFCVFTDSGGIQEEAPSLGKPVLVMRDTTERPEAIDAGTVILVGTDIDKIVNEANLLLNNTDRYKRMSKLHNPYGDGNASRRIIQFIRDI